MTFDLRTVPGKTLAEEPFAWVRQGQGDDILVVFAGARLNDEPMVFVILLAGQPMRPMPLVIGPEVLLDQLYTEIASERSPHLFDWSHAEGTQLVAVPDVWHVGVGQHELTIHANDLDERYGEHLFTLQVRGDGPPLPVARISSRLVTAVRREPAEQVIAEPSQQQDQ
jgi:hypothetical protein